MPPSPFRTWFAAVAVVLLTLTIIAMWFYLVVGGACEVHLWLFNDPTCL